jgi:hypothetical protein
MRKGFSRGSQSRAWRERICSVRYFRDVPWIVIRDVDEYGYSWSWTCRLRYRGLGVLVAVSMMQSGDSLPQFL